MELVFVKVKLPTNNRPQKTLREDIFKYYFEEKLYTRKDFTNKLNLNHRVFTTGLRAYYTPEKIEELRANKIVKSNIGVRVKKWEDKIKDIEVFIPNFRDIFENNIKTNPLLVMQSLVELNDKLYKAKISMKPIKKYANQSLRRLGENKVNLVANGLEAKFKFMLDDLGIEYYCQFKLGKYSFDFKVGKTLIEVDGQYHKYNSEYDKIKQEFAFEKGYNILRFTEEEINKQPLKVKKCLQHLK